MCSFFTSMTEALLILEIHPSQCLIQFDAHQTYVHKYNLKYLEESGYARVIIGSPHSAEIAPI